MDTTHHSFQTPDYPEEDHLSIGTKEYLKVLNAGNIPVESLSPADARNVLTTLQNSIKVDLSGITEEEKTIIEGDIQVKLTIVRPEGITEKRPVFIFVHGSGWISGDYITHKRLVRDLVVASGFSAVFVNHTPSTEAPFSVAINEIYTATQWVSEHGDEIHVDSSCMGIVGNSVGGNMACVTSLMAKEKGGPEIKVQILMWPVTDKTFDRKNPYLSPLQAPIDQLRGLPPTLIEVAENDILRDEGEALGRKLDEAGVEVTTIRFNGVIHDWGLLNGFAQLSPTRSLIRFTAATLKAYLKKDQTGEKIANAPDCM